MKKQHSGSMCGTFTHPATVLTVFAVLLALTIFASPAAQAQAESYSVVYTFTGGTDGANPSAGLVQDAQGVFYGTTLAGGVYNLGTLFKLDVNGTLTSLHSFAGGGQDGAYPEGTLFRHHGDYWGATIEGGTHNYGTVFQLIYGGRGWVVVRHNFHYGDGARPHGSPTLFNSGNVYGTTFGGGAAGYGNVFSLLWGGRQHHEKYRMAVLHDFTGADGAFPSGNLTPDFDLNLYGTTFDGGSAGYGTIFKLSLSGDFTVLHNFTGADGANPSAGVILDADGNLYGTTFSGGDLGFGTVFKMDTAGNVTVLHSFRSDDGRQPLAALIMSAKGILYGTASQGGIYHKGTVFEMEPSTGRFKVLHSFAGGADGEYPCASLTTDKKGFLMGTTSLGGANNAGTVYRISPR